MSDEFDKDPAFVAAFERTIKGMMAGKLSLLEARKRMREKLRAIGYAPFLDQLNAEGEDGEFNWLNTLLETNLSMRQCRAHWLRQQKSLESFPAQQMVRQRIIKHPRDWSSRWSEALARTTKDGATDSKKKAALVNHPIWKALCLFGNPYPPFEYDDDMGIEPLDWDETEALGLLPGPSASLIHRAMMNPRTE